MQHCGDNSIVFFGTGPVAAESLSFLTKHFPIEAVITKEVPAHHKGIGLVEELAKSQNIKIIFANNKEDLDSIFNEKLFCSRLGVVVDFGVIISNKVINYFELGILNSHFSLLPQWRGADPITFSILSGQKETGVSLMLIDTSLDTGNLIAQNTIGITPDETTPELTSRLIDLSNNMLQEYIPIYMSGKVKPYHQPNPDSATYSHKLSKSDGIIDWTKPAAQIEREVRAFAGWPTSKTTIEGSTITVVKSHVSDNKEDELDIICGDGKYLSIDELIAPSGRRMNSRAFINGYMKR